MSVKATYQIDQIKTGNDPVSTTEVTIASGQNLPEYTPIGMVTATGEYKKAVATANDGSENPVYFTAYEVDASGGAVKAQVVKSGTFTPDALAWDDSFDAAKKLTAFVGTPISLQTTERV